MQLKPQLGRPILPSDDGAPGSGNVAVLSDAFWHRAFGGSPDVLGKIITVNMTPVTIIGVNPATFVGPDGNNGSIPDVFLPLSLVSVLHPGVGPDDPLNPNLWWLQLMARAKPGISDAQAEAALNVQLNAAIRGTMTVAKDEVSPHYYSLMEAAANRSSRWASLSRSTCCLTFRLCAATGLRQYCEPDASPVPPCASAK